MLKLEIERDGVHAVDRKLVKFYLLDCCEQLVKFRSSGCLSKNLLIARRYLKGFAHHTQVHQAEWELEGEAFAVEYFSEKGVQVYFRVNKNIRADLVKVRMLKGLGNVESRKYLEDMAYFIDHVFCYIRHEPDWLFSDNCAQFLCPRLYTKYFLLTPAKNPPAY